MCPVGLGGDSDTPGRHKKYHCQDISGRFLHQWGCYFAWSDNQNVIKLVGIDCNYKVRDFEIIEDTVCFCGGYGGYGFVGWSSIPDLLSGSDGFHVYYNQFETRGYDFSSNLVPSWVSVYKDLTIFENMEDPERRVHIALVGETARGGACVAELKGFFNTNSWTYTTGADETNWCTADHVIGTDNYIVAAGRMREGTAIGSRIFYKTAMFTSGPLLGDIVHKYTSSTIFLTCRYPMESFQMTHMYHDTIATLSMFYDADYLVSEGFVTHVIDANNAAYAPDGTYCVDSRMVFVNNTPADNVRSLTYSDAMNSLAGLVLSNNPISTYSSLMGEQQFPFTASMDYFSRRDYSFLNHDRFFAQSGYLAMGRYESAPSTLAIFARHLSTTGIVHCGLGTTAPTVKDDFALKNDDVPLGLKTGTFAFEDEPPLPIEEPKLTVICFEP